MDAHQRPPEVHAGKAKPLNPKPRRERLSEPPDLRATQSPAGGRNIPPHWEAFLNGIDEPVFAVDGCETCYFANNAFTRLAGVQRGTLIGKKLGTLLVDPGGKRLRFRAGNRLPVKGMIRFRNDCEIPVELTAHPLSREERGVGWIVQVRKIAGDDERRRLELVGVMASGVAHDLSNILSPIIMGIQILRESSTPEAIAMVSGIIESAAHRGADILKQVLICARGTSSEFHRIDVSRLVVEAKEQASENLPSNIRIEVQAPTVKTVLQGDASQLRLMLACLLQAEADRFSLGGSLTLHAANAVLDTPESTLPDNARPGSYTRFHVSHWSNSPDSAAPMEDVNDRIPTTRAGVRLAMVRAVAQNHRGFVLATSSVVSAEIYIPATEPAAESIRSVNGEYAGGGEPILIVDREPGLRRIMSAVLQTAGYAVTAAVDPAEAQAAGNDTAKPFALIIADVSSETTQQIRDFRRANPSSRFILVTKEVGIADKNELIETQVEAFLMKPYLPQELLRTVREVLDRPESKELTQ